MFMTNVIRFRILYLTFYLITNWWSNSYYLKKNYVWNFCNYNTMMNLNSRVFQHSCIFSVSKINNRSIISIKDQVLIFRQNISVPREYTFSVYQFPIQIIKNYKWKTFLMLQQNILNKQAVQDRKSNFFEIIRIIMLLRFVISTC